MLLWIGWALLAHSRRPGSPKEAHRSTKTHQLVNFRCAPINRQPTFPRRGDVHVRRLKNPTRWAQAAGRLSKSEKAELASVLRTMPEDDDEEEEASSAKGSTPTKKKEKRPSSSPPSSSKPARKAKVEQDSSSDVEWAWSSGFTKQQYQDMWNHDSHAQWRPLVRDGPAPYGWGRGCLL